MTRAYALAGVPVGLPTASGAYLLKLRLADAVTLGIARFDGETLGPGLFVYADSARGPGGIAARVRRHLRRDKPLHWHVDRLTIAAAEIAAFPVPGARECALVDRLLATREFAPALGGFGSSDCRTCASHLLHWRSDRDERRLSPSTMAPEAAKLQ